MQSRLTYTFCFVLTFWVFAQGLGQTNEQRALEAKRAQLQKEIGEINRLLFVEKKQKGSVLDQMESLDQKISVQEKLIRVTNQQTNLLNRQINANIRNISDLRKELEALKAEYATMIQKSYENRSEQGYLLFLLSSESFYNAFKRYQYLKQYRDFRREQGQKIVEKTARLSQLNKDLTEQRKEKELLLAENNKAKKELEREKSTQNELLATIKKNERQYTASIQRKEREARAIDRQIEDLIRKAIAASNVEAEKKSGNVTKTNTAKSSGKFVLTPEAKVLASNFTASKGKHIWPVEKGIKSRGFGVYSDPVYPGIKHQNNGVIIATDQGSKARAIFGGEVIAILSVPGGNKGVQIKHGNYISTYYNLATLYVKKGDTVAMKEALGEIYTNRTNGETKLKFYLYQNTTRLNPEEWIYRL